LASNLNPDTAHVIHAGPGGLIMPLLYNSPVSGNCYKVRLLLAQLGVEYERREIDVIDRSDRPRLLGELNPALSIPVAVLDDGTPLAESHAILWYFAEGTPYLPDDRLARARVLQWLSFEQYSLQPYVALLRYWLSIAKTPVPQQKIDARKPAGYFALDALERRLGEQGFLVEERYTIADIALFAYTHVAPEGSFELATYPAIRGWISRVQAQPGHVAIEA
jgi:glutathione S-transferase